MADIAVLGFDIDSTPARTAATDLAKLQNAATKLASSMAKTDTALRRANGQFASSAEVVAEYGREVQELAAKYNPALSAVYKFQQAEAELNRALMLGVVTNEQYDASLERVRLQLAQQAEAAQAAANGVRMVGTAARTGGDAMEVSGHHAANLSFQLNDIGMMMASGQSPFMLMMQQGPQVAQVFSQMTAQGQRIGPTLASAFRMVLNPTTLLTLAVIGGTAALFQWAGAGKTAKTTIDDINSSIQGLKTAVEEIRSTPSLLTAEGITQITTQYGMLNIQVASHVAELQRLNVEALRFKNIDMFADLRSQFAGGIFSTELRNMASSLGLNVGQANQLSAAFDRLGDADGPDEQIKAINRLLEVLALATKDQKELTKEQFQFRTSLLEARDAVMQQKAALDQYNGSIGTANQLTVAYAGTLGILATAARTAAEAQRVLNEQVAFGNTLDPLNGFSRASSDYVQIALGGTLRTPTVTDPEDDDDTGTGGGGGGGGASAVDQIQEDFKNRWQALQEGFKGEFDLSLVEYQKQLETLDWALNQKLIKEQEFQRNKQMLYTMTFGTESQQNLLQYQLDQEALQLALDQKLITHQTYLERLRQMQFDYQSQAHMTDQNMLAANLGRTSNYFGQLVSLTGNSYDTLAKLQQSFAAGQALVNAYLAASQTLADPTLGFWGKMAAYGKVLAAGLGLVSAIKGAGGGSGGGASGGAGGQAATAAQQEPNREVLVRLEGDEWLVGMASNIMEQIYEQTKDGRVVVARDF